MKTKHDPKIDSQPAAELEPSVRDDLLKRSRDGQLPCAVIFDVAKELKRQPADIGRAMDRLDLRIVKCQLGLFGYTPAKKIVRAAESIQTDMQAAIRAKLENGKLPCRDAWKIARDLKVPKMAVSAACEALKIKIKPCQLGAF